MENLSQTETPPPLQPSLKFLVTADRFPSHLVVKLGLQYFTRRLENTFRIVLNENQDGEAAFFIANNRDGQLDITVSYYDAMGEINGTELYENCVLLAAHRFFQADAVLIYELEFSYG